MAKKANNPFARTLISNANMDPAQKFRIEEAYKSIRTNIMLSILKKGCKTIVVSSGSPAEGKTTTTINLAISIAQADQRVLLIDCDLRKPKMHHYFGVSNAPGLTNYISDSVKTTALRRTCTALFTEQNFPTIAAVRRFHSTNPAELLGSEPMAEFLLQISRDYDYVIIDTPPLNVVSDALPIIRESDGVVIVVRANGSTHPEVQKVMESLEFIDAKVLGFIYNFAEDKRSRYSRYKYGYDYGYGYGYGYDAGAE